MRLPPTSKMKAVDVAHGRVDVGPAVGGQAAQDERRAGGHADVVVVGVFVGHDHRVGGDLAHRVADLVAEGVDEHGLAAGRLQHEARLPEPGQGDGFGGGGGTESDDGDQDQEFLHDFSPCWVSIDWIKSSSRAASRG